MTKVSRGSASRGCALTLPRCTARRHLASRRRDVERLPPYCPSAPPLRTPTGTTHRRCRNAARKAGWSPRSRPRVDRQIADRGIIRPGGTSPHRSMATGRPGPARTPHPAARTTERPLRQGHVSGPVLDRRRPTTAGGLLPRVEMRVAHTWRKDTQATPIPAIECGVHRPEELRSTASAVGASSCTPRPPAVAPAARPADRVGRCPASPDPLGHPRPSGPLYGLAKFSIARALNSNTSSQPQTPIRTQPTPRHGLRLA